MIVLYQLQKTNTGIASFSIIDSAAASTVLPVAPARLVGDVALHVFHADAREQHRSGNRPGDPNELVFAPRAAFDRMYHAG